MNPLVIYKWYQSAMAGVGRKIVMPANTDPEKTYQYRAVSRFATMMDEWGLSDNSVRSLVRAIVRYGKKKNLLGKGTQLLNMKSIVNICYDMLQEEVARNEVFVTELRKSNEFINKHTDIVELLVTKEQKNGYTNITRWVRAGDLSLGFISLSMNCRQAVSLLPYDERDEFPSDTELLRNRIAFLSDPDLRMRIKEIMGSDLITSGVQMEHIQ
jgi:hypothetical protein